MLALQRYDFDLDCAPGKTVVVADALPRAYLPSNQSEISTTQMKAFVHTLVKSIPISDTKLLAYQEATANDKTLQLVAKYLKDGWPDKRELEPCVIPFYTIRDDITHVQGLLLKGAQRIIVPSLHCKEVRKLIHTGHLGIEKCISLAKECVY